MKTIEGQGRPLLIYGAGGHGWVVADAAQLAGWRIVGFIDDTPNGERVGDWPVFQRDVLDKPDLNAHLIVAIGDNALRRRISYDMFKRGRLFATVAHPTAAISAFATVADGVFIGANAVINAQAQVGDGVIVNSGAIVEHHCKVGAYAHVAPKATLGGEVTVGEMTLVGVGVSVRPKITIGSNCTVGVGAAVVKDVPDNRTVVGVPGSAML